ncbi:MAG: ankyrin repeat domain-containing protein [Actinomycetaceae bacterium]|nr:ankyrin repeat domain-containing protein [Actinomycetaceae bacterium]
MITMQQTRFISQDSSERAGFNTERRSAQAARIYSYREEDLINSVIQTYQLAIENAGELAVKSLSRGYKVQEQMEEFSTFARAKDFDKADQAKSLLSERIQHLERFVGNHINGIGEITQLTRDKHEFTRQVVAQLKQLAPRPLIDRKFAEEVASEMHAITKRTMDNSSIKHTITTPDGKQEAIGEFTPAQLCANIISDIRSENSRINNFHRSLVKALARCCILEAVKKDLVAEKESLGVYPESMREHRLNSLNETLEACNATLDISRMQVHTAKQMVLKEKLDTLLQRLKESAQKTGNGMDFHNITELHRMILAAEAAPLPINYSTHVGTDGYNAISPDAANMRISSLSAANFARLQRFADKYQLSEMDRRLYLDCLPHQEDIGNSHRKFLAGDKIEKQALLAAQHGNVEALEKLKNNGYDINERGQNGETIAMVAAHAMQPQITEILKSAGIDVDAKDNTGRTALDYLREGLEGAKALMEYAKEFTKQAEQSVGITT